jgi:hypothetical protein
MSEDTDRIPVPTNGRGPHDDLESSPADDDADGPDATARDQNFAFTPNQLAVGFGIVAGILLLFAGARRRRGRSGRGE